MSHCVCASDHEGNFYTGGANGDVFVWTNHVFVKNISAHKGGFVSSIRFVDYKLYTGGKDGDIKIWTGLGEDITCEHTISFGSMIRAIDCRDGYLLVGTRDGTLTVVGDEESRKEIMHSHNDGETWGLASFDANCVITSGDDNQVIVWDVEERKRSKVYGVSSREAKAKKGGASSITNKPASQCARAVCLGPNGETIVAANDGVVHVHCADGSNVKLEDSSEWIECLTVSPCGKFLAVGSHDNKIRVYSCDGWALCGTGGKHSSYIMALDWSTDSTYLRSNCGAYELLFWTVAEDGSIEQDASGRSNTKAQMWASKTVKFFWDVDGIYPKGTDGTHINRVAGNEAGDLIITGDDWCNVRVFRDPVRKGHKCRTYRGHSEFVTNCIFKGDRIFTVGGYDQTLMQWKLC